MDDIKQRDKQLFREELLKPSRVARFVGYSLIPIFIAWKTRDLDVFGQPIFPQSNVLAICALAIAVIVAIYLREAFLIARQRQFSFPHLKQLWESCKERLKLLKSANAKLKKGNHVALEEMPVTIEKVSTSLYAALRRADMLMAELANSEGPLLHKIFQGTLPTGSIAENTAAKSLYQIADRNVAEYKQNYSGVLRGVQITEAQATVFVTTLDTLRLKLLSYRIAHNTPNVDNKELLDSLGEAKMQLESIDKALDELDMNPFRVAPVENTPPPMPGSFAAELEQKIGDTESS